MANAEHTKLKADLQDSINMYNALLQEEAKDRRVLQTAQERVIKIQDEGETDSGQLKRAQLTARKAQRALDKSSQAALEAEVVVQDLTDRAKEAEANLNQLDGEVKATATSSQRKKIEQKQQKRRQAVDQLTELKDSGTTINMDNNLHDTEAKILADLQGRNKATVHNTYSAQVKKTLAKDLGKPASELKGSLGSKDAYKQFETTRKFINKQTLKQAKAKRWITERQARELKLKYDL